MYSMFLMLRFSFEYKVTTNLYFNGQSLSLVAAHWMVQGNFGPGCLHLQDSDVISLRGSPSIRSFQSERGDFSGGPVVKNSPANAGDTGSIPAPERFHMLRGN